MARLSWGIATDAGKLRERNEDSVLAQPPMFAVADGMGGHAAGEVASALVVAELEPLAEQPQLDQDEIAAAIARGNRRILEHAVANPSEEGMGTTVAGIAIVAPGGIEHWLVFNVGDSRVYRWAEGLLAQITVDHSEVEELIAAGRVSRSEARSHKSRSVVTRALGVDPPPEIDWWLLPVVAGERFLVCSDGLFTELSDVEIADAVGRSAPAQVAAELVERAVAAGGRDNVTVIAIAVADEQEAGAEEDTAPRLSVEVASVPLEADAERRQSNDDGVELPANRLISEVPGGGA